MAVKDEYFDAMSGGKEEVRTSLSGFEQMVTGFIPMHHLNGQKNKSISLKDLRSLRVLNSRSIVVLWKGLILLQSQKSSKFRAISMSL
jgi:hypothetical protein